MRVNSTTEITVVCSAIGSFSTPRRVNLVDDHPKTRSGRIIGQAIKETLESVAIVTALGIPTRSTILTPYGGS